jgi:hypothetical protein
MTTDAYFDDIKSLKAGQMLNCEIIQSLAESVSDLASVISRVQGNEVKNNSNFSKNTEKSDVEQSEYANFANTKSSFVLEELTDSLMNNNNNNNRISLMKENVLESNDNDMSYINLISLMNNNNNNNRISLMKENVLESNDNDMSYINLNESSTGASLLNTQQKSTYAEVVKSFSGLGKSSSNIANSAVKVTGKEYIRQLLRQQDLAKSVLENEVGIRQFRPKGPVTRCNFSCYLSRNI